MKKLVLIMAAAGLATMAAAVPAQAAHGGWHGGHGHGGWHRHGGGGVNFSFGFFDPYPQYYYYAPPPVVYYPPQPVYYYPYGY